MACWGGAEGRCSAFGEVLEDPRSLRAVIAAVNRAKGAAGPSNWMPPDESFTCTYLADWVSIKARWQLSMDQSEFGRIRSLLTDRCPDQTIEAWPDTPAPGPPILAAPVQAPPPIPPS